MIVVLKNKMGIFPIIFLLNLIHYKSVSIYCLVYYQVALELSDSTVSYFIRELKSHSDLSIHLVVLEF